jgi:hypothetical protein
MYVYDSAMKLLSEEMSSLGVSIGFFHITCFDTYPRRPIISDDGIDHDRRSLEKQEKLHKKISLVDRSIDQSIEGILEDIFLTCDSNWSHRIAILKPIS